jgi:hypothetical protein
MPRDKLLFFFFPGLSPYDKGESNIPSFIHLYNFFVFPLYIFWKRRRWCVVVVVVVVVVRRGGGSAAAAAAPLEEDETEEEE